MPSIRVETKSSEMQWHLDNMRNMSRELDSLTYGEDASRIVDTIGSISFDSWKDTVSTTLQSILEQLSGKIDAIRIDVEGGGFASLVKTISSLVSVLAQCVELRKAIESWEDYLDSLPLTVSDGNGGSIANPEIVRAKEMIQSYKARLQPLVNIYHSQFS